MRTMRAHVRELHPGGDGRGSPESTRQDEPSSTPLALAAGAGVVGPVLFTLAFLAQEFVRMGEYDPIALPVSALEAGQNGWVQQVSFAVFGLLTMAHAVGMHRGVRPSVVSAAGSGLLLLSGVGLLLAAVFPLRADEAGMIYDPGGHRVAGLVFFLSSALAFITLARALGHDPRWRDLATYTLVAGAVALVGFVVTGALVMPEDAPLHAVAGLVQRVLILVVIFPCRIVLAARLLRVARLRRS